MKFGRKSCFTYTKMPFLMTGYTPLIVDREIPLSILCIHLQGEGDDKNDQEGGRRSIVLSQSKLLTSSVVKCRKEIMQPYLMDSVCSLSFELFWNLNATFIFNLEGLS